MTDTAREVTGSQTARAILFCGPASDHATIVQSNGSATESRQVEGYQPEAVGLHTMVCRLNKPIRMNRDELETHPAWQELGGEAAFWKAAGGWLAAPLMARDGHNLGLIEVLQKSTGDFTVDDEAVLVQLAQMGSIAIENTLYAAERETNRIKDEFLSTLSHELRTPLNAILGWTQLLRTEPLEPDTAHGLEVIDRNARAQTKLIEDLLDVSRITTGKLQLNLRPTVLGPVIQAAADTLRPTVEAKHITVDCELDAAASVVEADPDRLQQIFWNLFSNAAKFTPENGKIVVRLDRVGDSVQLRVTDTGRGINRAFLPYVFDRFRQADSTSTRSHGGLGIGLTIVRHIVQLHGGTVEANSPGEGQGATFTVTLPLAIAGANGHANQPEVRSRVTTTEAGVATAMEEQVHDLRGIRILIVDDEPDALEVIAAAVKQAGATVMLADSVDGAIAQFTRSRPDVVISDIAMPEKDGFDLIRFLRELSADEGGDVPALAVTAYARDEDRKRVLAAGFQHHIAKPVDPRALTRIIAQLQIPV
jgi:signal transduction histidine kinase/ActR/RegA family two-component response regulator